jgi:hypothetical protein
LNFSNGVHISLFGNKIICLNYEKILILNYDLNQEKILFNEEIILNDIKNCFEIKKDHFLIVKYQEHILWVNKKQKIKMNINYNNKKIFPVNDEYYLVYNSESHVLMFIDVDTLQEITRLNKIIDPKKISILNNEFIAFINFSEIYLFYIKNKELVQIISFDSNYSFFNNYEIFIVDKSIYLLKGQNLKKFKFISEDKDFEETSINISGLSGEKEFGFFLASEDF